MLEQDYLMRLLMQFFRALVNAAERVEDKEHPDYHAAADMLEDAISNATEMDGATLLSLAPESISQVMRVSGIDPNVTQFVARSMLLESVYLDEAGQGALARVREQQARAIAAEYGFDLPDDPSDFDAITEGLEEAAAKGGFEGGQPAYSEHIGAEDAFDDFLAASGVSLGDELVYEDPDTYFEPLPEEAPTGFGAFIEFEDDE